MFNEQENTYDSMEVIRKFLEMSILLLNKIHQLEIIWNVLL